MLFFDQDPQNPYDTFFSILVGTLEMKKEIEGIEQADLRAERKQSEANCIDKAWQRH
jgi:hypothetical protein